MHFVPDLTFDDKHAYHNPMMEKFAGYAQYPYKIGPFPEHLKAPDVKPKYSLRKSYSERSKSTTKSHDKVHSKSIILEHSTESFMKPDSDDRFFQTSFFNMSSARPLPNKAKKSCYNYKCKYMKQFVFDEKGKTEMSTRFSLTKDKMGSTLGRSFH